MPVLQKYLSRFSIKQFFYYLKARQPTEHLLHSIDQDSFKTLLHYKDDTGHPQYKKYFNAPYWLRLNVQRALYLGLNRKQPLSILDIGAGFGYFPYVAKFYGHDVLGIDLPDDKLFAKASEFLNVARAEYCIKPHTPIPSFGKKFDLITAFQVCFNGHIEGEIWHEAEWDSFLKDLFANHINEGGQLYMEMNWSPHINGWLPDSVVHLFKEKYNASFDGPSRVSLFSS